MPTSLIEGNSLLAVDVGSVTTRVAFFDVVEGHYRYVGMGQAPSTAGAPWHDIGPGMRQAVENLQAMLSRPLLDSDGQLILPSQPDGAGVDTMVATLSAGPALKTVVVGLLPDVSLESVQHLARTTYARTLEAVGLNDLRKPDQQLDALLRVEPDLILLAGGTDGGAVQSLQRIMETVGLVCYLLPEEKRPAVLFAGNNKLMGEFQAIFNNLARAVRVTANIRPAIDVEDLEPAQKELADVVTTLRRQRLTGTDGLYQGAGGAMFPTAFAYGRMIRFLGQVHKPGPGVLGVDLGASSTTVAASFDGLMRLNVFPQFGMGESLINLQRLTALEEVEQWLPLEVGADTVRDYLYQKSLYPGTLPVTAEDLGIEEALARQNLFLAGRAAMATFPKTNLRAGGFLPPFRLILAGGGVLGGAPTPGQSLLMILDGLQPVGVSLVRLDKSNVLPMLGAAAEKNTILPVHVIDSPVIAHLGTVVSAITSAGFGSPVLRVRMRYADGQEAKIEVKRGAIEVLPLAEGDTAHLRVQPLGRADVGLGPGRAIDVEVSGGSLGVVIDARGRPLVMPRDPSQRRELIKKWLWTVGG